ncbi:MAG: oxygen-independent coproporphyrinogen III oxidase [Bacteroidia bacterium]|nr:oxygen-independent coproporphyrinogen III oxidase [Bacteroidia bacterium]
MTEELLKKYNVPVPRYTSYPPANHFSDSFSADGFVQMLKESNNRNPENIAIYIHIPFCEKICFYCGCNACSIGSGSTVVPYLDAVRKEIEMVTRYIDKKRPVSQIHYGGGTPNSIDVSFIKSLNDFLFSEFTFIDNPEIAIECNPAYLDYKYVDNLISAGFNRFSLGIQDFDKNILDKVNRAPSAIPPAELFSYIKSEDERIGVNFDFIYGLPGQSVSSFTRTMQMAADIRPDRLVTFSYAHVPWVKKHQLILEKRGLPSSGDKTNMFLSAYDLLKKSGYEPIGLDHFVLPSDDLFKSLDEGTLHRNFQGYCTRRTTGQVYAFGVTAISQLDEGYSQNRKEINDYITDISAGLLPVERGYKLSHNQMIVRKVINDLMCNKTVNFHKVATDMRVSPDEVSNSVLIDTESLKEMEADGLILRRDDRIDITETGTFFIRNIAATFDRDYIEKAQTYSKPV